MTTTTPSTGVTFVQAATMLAAHLADHTLPEPASLRVNTSGLHSDVMAQLRSTTVPTVARDLLAWADTLSTVTVHVDPCDHDGRDHHADLAHHDRR